MIGPKSGEAYSLGSGYPLQVLAETAPGFPLLSLTRTQARFYARTVSVIPVLNRSLQIVISRYSCF